MNHNIGSSERIKLASNKYQVVSLKKLLGHIFYPRPIYTS